MGINMKFCKGDFCEEKALNSFWKKSKLFKISYVRHPITLLISKKKRNINNNQKNQSIKSLYSSSLPRTLRAGRKDPEIPFPPSSPLLTRQHQPNWLG